MVIEDYVVDGWKRCGRGVSAACWRRGLAGCRAWLHHLLDDGRKARRWLALAAATQIHVLPRNAGLLCRSVHARKFDFSAHN